MSINSAGGPEYRINHEPYNPYSSGLALPRRSHYTLSNTLSNQLATEMLQFRIYSSYYPVYTPKPVPQPMSSCKERTLTPKPSLNPKL